MNRSFAPPPGLPSTGGTVSGPMTIQDLLTLARLSMTSPDDDTVLITLVAPAANTTDPVASEDLMKVMQGGVEIFWLNENGSPRGRSAKTTEAAVRWYGMSGQSADIWQVLDNRTNNTVLASVKPDGRLVITGNLTAANYANGAWTALSATNGAYTAVTSGDTDHPPAYRLEGQASEIVRLRGRFTVTNTTANDVVTTLPTGARPSKVIRAQVPNGQSTYIGVSVGSNGQVIIGRTVSSASWVSLDGIVFTTSS